MKKLLLLSTLAAGLAANAHAQCEDGACGPVFDTQLGIEARGLTADGVGPAVIAVQLMSSDQVDGPGVEILETRTVTVADGRTREVPCVRPLQVFFKNRQTLCGALMMGDEVLLGAVQMEDMDLVLLPGQRKINVNPQNPNFPHMIVK